MHRVPEVEITRLYDDATQRIDAQLLVASMIPYAQDMKGELVYVGKDMVKGKVVIVWRFKFRSRGAAQAFDAEYSDG